MLLCWAVKTVPAFRMQLHNFSMKPSIALEFLQENSGSILDANPARSSRELSTTDLRVIEEHSLVFIRVILIE